MKNLHNPNLALISIDYSDSRIMVLYEALGIPMVRINGQWRHGIFTAEDLNENFECVPMISTLSEELFYEALEVIACIN